MTMTERIDEIDRMLFDAGVLVLSAKTNAARTAADHKITEARVQLDKLRSRFE
jgi:hypothetical protein